MCVEVGGLLHQLLWLEWQRTVRASRASVHLNPPPGTTKTRPLIKLQYSLASASLASQLVDCAHTADCRLLRFTRIIFAASRTGIFVWYYSASADIRGLPYSRADVRPSRAHVARETSAGGISGG